MAIELLEAAILAVLVGFDAFAYSKLKESERDLERLQQSHAPMREATNALHDAMKANEMAASHPTEMPQATMVENAIDDRLPSIERDIISLENRSDALQENVSNISAKLDEIEFSLQNRGNDANYSEIQQKLMEIQEKMSDASGYSGALDKIKQEHEELKGLRDRVVKLEEEIASHLGESSVNYATMLQKLENVSEALGKQVKTTEKKIVKEEKATKKLARKVKATKKKTDKKITKVAKQAGKKIAAVKKATAKKKAPSKKAKKSR